MFPHAALADARLLEQRAGRTDRDAGAAELAQAFLQRLVEGRLYRALEAALREADCVIVHQFRAGADALAAHNALVPVPLYQRVVVAYGKALHHRRFVGDVFQVVFVCQVLQLNFRDLIFENFKDKEVKAIDLGVSPAD